MYKLLVVDDEPYIADFIAELFKRQTQLELEVLKAYSGSGAIKILNERKVDLVLADIKMPEINGLQLLDIILENWPRCRVIFLSGYREFDYVYTAVKKGCVRYLLKTEEDEAIVKTVEEVIQEIEESMNDADILDKANAQIRIALPLLQKEFLEDWLYEVDSMKELTQNRLEELNIPLYLNRDMMMVVGRFDGIFAGKSVAEKDRLYYSLEQIVEDNVADRFLEIHVSFKREIYVYLIQIKEEAKAKMDSQQMQVLLLGTFEYIQCACKKSLGMTISFAISSVAFTYEEAGKQFMQLKKLLTTRIGFEKEMIISDRSLNATSYDKTDLIQIKLINQIKEMENHLETGQAEAFFNQFEQITKHLSKLDNPNDYGGVEIYYSIANLLLRFINKWKIADELCSKINLYQLMRIDEHESWGDAVDYLDNLIHFIFEIRQNGAKQQAMDVVISLQQYIRANLDKDLSLSLLADKVHLNASYLSRLFKKVSDKNLSEYLNEQRAEKAKELLKNTNLMINEISVKVGYESQQSFNRFFRNITGMSPQEYRRCP